MKRLVFGVAVFVFMSSGQLMAQDTAEPAPVDGVTAPTEDMWFYLQELRRYDDPQVMIRRREERKAEQRRMRLAAMKWFGFSPSRPIANPVPFYGTAAPIWVGNGHNQFHWVGGGRFRSAVNINVETTRR